MLLIDTDITILNQKEWYLKELRRTGIHIRMTSVKLQVKKTPKCQCFKHLILLFGACLKFVFCYLSFRDCNGARSSVG